MFRIEFGTAGLRGRMAVGPANMNDLVVLQTTQGLAKYILAQDEHAKERGVVVGYDGRHRFVDDSLSLDLLFRIHSILHLSICLSFDPSDSLFFISPILIHSFSLPAAPPSSHASLPLCSCPVAFACTSSPAVSPPPLSPSVCSITRPVRVSWSQPPTIPSRTMDTNCIVRGYSLLRWLACSLILLCLSFFLLLSLSLSISLSLSCRG